MVPYLACVKYFANYNILYMHRFVFLFFHFIYFYFELGRIVKETQYASVGLFTQALLNCYIRDVILGQLF